MKKLLTLILTITMSLGALFGCSLIKTDKTRYYEQVVAVVEYDNNKIEYTKLDLYYYYTYYGSNYTSEGVTKEIIESMVNDMVDRDILIKEIKADMGEYSEKQKNSILKQVYDYIDSNLKTIENTIREEKGEPTTTGEGPLTEEKTLLRDERQKYTPVIVVKDNTSNLPLNEQVLSREDFKQREGLEGVLASYAPKFDYDVPGKTNYSKLAWNRFLNNLVANYKNYGLNFTREQALEYEIDRLYKYEEANCYISDYQAYYTSKLSIEVDSVLSYFRNKYLLSHANYFGNLSAYVDDMNANFGDYSEIYYHENSGSEYIWVSQILINKDEESKKDDETDTTLAYSTKINNEQGEEVVVSVDNAINYITAAVMGENTLASKAAKLEELIYIYNDDPGVMNASFYYAVNTTASKNQNLDEKFVEKAIETKVGEIGVVETDFGWHIIMNLGKVENVAKLNYTRVYNNQFTWQDLYYTNLKLAGDKNWFNHIYDTVNTDSTRVSERLNNLIQTGKRAAQSITVYPKAFEDYWK